MVMVLFTACKNEDASIAKIYVRSSSNQLVPGATVVIIGDVEYVDTAITNSAGFAQFNMAPYFAKDGAGPDLGVFDIVAKMGDDSGQEKGLRVRINNTAVRTVYFEE